MNETPDKQASGAPPLEFTGERFTPQCVREIWYEHWHRYALAAQFADGKRVLDLACGEGYGAHLLAGRAASVLAVDIDEPTIDHARATYPASNVDYVVGSATQVPGQDDEFDLVISFETIEHLAEQEQMLDEFRRVLKPDGLLLISSPDKARYSDASGYQNEFHVRELYRHEFLALLTPRFPAVRLLGQQLMFHSAIWPIDGSPGSQLVSQQLGDGKVRQLPALQGQPLYFIAACAASEAQVPTELAASWLFADVEQSVYEHYQHEIGKNMQAGELLAQRDAQILQLQAELERLKKGV